MPKPTELPSTLSTPAQITAATNQRVRELNSFLDASVVQNPAIADVDLATFQIHNVGDPANDTDAVNLRTLKKYQTPAAAPLQVSGAKGIITFGVDDDTVGSNVIGKYGVVPFAFSPNLGQISVVGLPTTADAQWDIQRSGDKGLTWSSIFALGSPKVTFPMGGTVFEVTFGGFATGLGKGDLVRLDGLFSGGATGVVIVISG